MPTPPAWLEKVAGEVATWLQAHEQIPVGCHYFESGEGWEVSLFLMRVEVFGGARDGQVVTLPYLLDLTGLATLLDEVESLTWQTARLGNQDDIGPHISLVGRAREHRVWIRVLAEAPLTTPPAGRICSQTLQLQEF